MNSEKRRASERLQIFQAQQRLAKEKRRLEAELKRQRAQAQRNAEKRALKKKRQPKRGTPEWRRIEEARMARQMRLAERRRRAAEGRTLRRLKGEEEQRWAEHQRLLQQQSFPAQVPAAHQQQAPAAVQQAPAQTQASTHSQHVQPKHSLAPEQAVGSLQSVPAAPARTEPIYPSAKQPQRSKEVVQSPPGGSRPVQTLPPRGSNKIQEARKVFHVVVDGLNIIRCSSGRVQPKPDLCILLTVLAALKKNLIYFDCFFDPNTRNVLANFNPEQVVYFDALLERHSSNCIVVPSGSEADDFLLNQAKALNCVVVSNDRFRDYWGKHPWLSAPTHYFDQLGHKVLLDGLVAQVAICANRVLIPQLGINEPLIDSLDELLNKLG